MLTSSTLYSQEKMPVSSNSISAEQVKQLKIQAGKQERSSETNLPVSKKPQAQNTKNTGTSTSNSPQNKKPVSPQPIKKNKSLVSHYYSILTQIQLDTFGRDAFNDYNDSSILFYKKNLV